VNLGTDRTARAISAGNGHTCAALDDGSVRCWGYAGNGRLGYADQKDIGDNEPPGSAGPVQLGGAARAISVGDAHSCAILDDGSVRCWGYGEGGRLGYGNQNDIGDDETPSAAGAVDLGPGRSAVAISAGGRHTCAQLDDGSVRCWGEGFAGRLGYCNEQSIGDDETPRMAGAVNLATPACGLSAPAPAPSDGAPPGTPPAAATPLGGPFTAKLQLARARIARSERLLDVFAPITTRASGRVSVQLHAAGIRHRFTAPVSSRGGRIRFRQPIPRAQAALGTGILTIGYPGDGDTTAQTVRLRAASQPARLRVTRPVIAGGRLRASGSVVRQARGVVRVQVHYVTGGERTTLTFGAPIRNGRWSLNERLSQAVLDAIARRSATVHSYTLFTGYQPRRIRGEMRSLQILAAP